MSTTPEEIQKKTRGRVIFKNEEGGWREDWGLIQVAHQGKNIQEK